MPTFYVAPAGSGGSNSNPGSEAQPWLTLTFAISSMAASDTVFVRQGTYTSAITNPPSGSSGNPTQFLAYPAETPTLNITSGQSMTLTSRNWVVIDGFTITSGGTGSWALINGGSNNVIKNCTFNDAVGTTHGIFITASSTGNKIQDCVLDTHGTTTYQGGLDSLKIFTSDTNLVENCVVTDSDHCGIQIVGGNNNILRGNTVTNTRGQAIEIHDGQNGTPNSRNNVIEGNIAHAPNWGTDGLASPGIVVAAAQTIVRRNIVYGCQSGGLHVEGFADQASAGSTESFDSRIYNNTSYDNGLDGPTTDIWKDGMGGASTIRYEAATMTTNTYKNNILVGNRIDRVGPPDLRNVQIACMDFVSGSALRGTTRWVNNLVWGTANGQNIFYDTDVGTPETLAAVHTNYPTSFQGNIEGDPLFANAAAQDFALGSGSPAINAGTSLTLANGASTGTSLTVDDSLYFSDGNGLVAGDMIVIGNTVEVEVTNVNYTTHVLTLASSRTWADNDPVYLSFTGSAPDLGALEFEASNTVTVLRSRRAQISGRR